MTNDYSIFVFLHHGPGLLWPRPISWRRNRSFSVFLSAVYGDLPDARKATTPKNELVGFYRTVEIQPDDTPDTLHVEDGDEIDIYFGHDHGPDTFEVTIHFNAPGLGLEPMQILLRPNQDVGDPSHVLDTICKKNNILANNGVHGSGFNLTHNGQSVENLDRDALDDAVIVYKNKSVAQTGITTDSILIATLLYANSSYQIIVEWDDGHKDSFIGFDKLPLTRLFNDIRIAQGSAETITFLTAERTRFKDSACPGNLALSAGRKVHILATKGATVTVQHYPREWVISEQYAMGTNWMKTFRRFNEAAGKNPNVFRMPSGTSVEAVEVFVDSFSWYNRTPGSRWNIDTPTERRNMAENSIRSTYFKNGPKVWIDVYAIAHETFHSDLRQRAIKELLWWKGRPLDSVDILRKNHWFEMIDILYSEGRDGTLMEDLVRVLISACLDYAEELSQRSWFRDYYTQHPAFHMRLDQAFGGSFEFSNNT